LVTSEKYVGEMNPAEVEDAMFGKYKQWEQLKPQNWSIFEKTVIDLMGKDVNERRDFLFKNVNFKDIKFM